MLINTRLNEKDVSLRFEKTIYILISTMILVSQDKLARQKYNRDIYTQVLINVTTHKQVCHIEQRFGKLLLEYNSIEMNQMTSSIVNKSKLNNSILNKPILKNPIEDPLNWFPRVWFNDADWIKASSATPTPD